ncbi:MAG: twin-arginine translocase subunit TatC [Bythopirellula sp.]|nr:twin-arginine translocase subunit TatC [Bythopirellula sp.]
MPADPKHSADEELLEKTKMSFSEHLEELRTALFKCLAAWMVGTLFGFAVGWQVVDYVQTPLREALDTFYRGQAEQAVVNRLEEQQAAGDAVPDDIPTAAAEMADEGLVPEDLYVDPAELSKSLGIEKPTADPKPFPTTRENLIRLRLYRTIETDPRLNVISLSGQEPFMIYMKASVVVGAMLASPFIFYYLWNFVAAGLYKRERNMVYLYLPMSLGLFFAGAALAFFVAFDYVLDFLFWFNAQMGIAPTPRISDWMSFVLFLPLGFGISFQLPLVMVALERVGIFTIESYRSSWRIAVVVIFTISMLLTPADPGSMLLMALPLTVLYFFGIWLCKKLPRGGTPQ